jgi:hypothetical protein
MRCFVLTLNGRARFLEMPSDFRRDLTVSHLVGCFDPYDLRVDLFMLEVIF